MDIYTNHKRLFWTAASLFMILTIFVAVMPAIHNQQNNGPLPGSMALTALQEQGKGIFISEGCVACHTQQVRNLDMDKNWGSRPGVAADYARNTRTDFWRNTATLMGSERTGPDLTNIGNRQSSAEWHLLHLYNPRSVVPASIMPSYSWLFRLRDFASQREAVVNIPDEFAKGIKRKIIASAEAMALVAYLQSLKQVDLPTGKPVPVFLYGKGLVTEDTPLAARTANKPALNGAALYARNCQACHQQNGKGIPGAFPALKGSKIVLDPDPDVQITVIMKGYNGRANEGFGIMPPVGTDNKLKPEEVTAIVNHERSSWQNNARKISVEEVKKIIASLKLPVN